MYNHILIPVSFDASKDIEKVTEVAQALGDKGATYTFFHVIEELPGYYSNYLPQEAFKINRKKLQGDLDALAADVPNGRAEIADGHSGRTVVSWAKENAVDCIVVASHQPAFSDILLGSTAQYVVRHASCAVHVLR